MKKSLLFAAVALLAVTAGNAQMKRSDMAKQNVKIDLPELTVQKPLAKMQEAQLNEGKKEMRAPQVAPKDNVRAWYNRPAGTFYFNSVAVGDDYAGGWNNIYLQMKPYSQYTWKNVSEGADSYLWNVETWVVSDPATGDGSYQVYNVEDTDLVTEYGIEYPDAPKLTANGGGASDTYNLFCLIPGDKEYTRVDGSAMSMVSAENISTWAAGGYRLFGQSHPAIIRSETEEYAYTYYRGATPHGSNQYGWFFGKNDNGFDGICQVFEKPEHPYALKSVALDYGKLQVGAEPATLTANVYRLLVDQPQYVDDGETNAVLKEEDLELLSSSTIEVDTAMATHTWLIFPMVSQDGDLVYEDPLHVDDAILIEITGYNGEHSVSDEGALLTADNNMIDFSGLVTTDEIPEGFGEMAFIKRYRYMAYDDNNEPYLLEEPYYQYEGLNNFFTSGEMKTGFGILVEVEMPFMVFNYTAETGEYEFPVEGGSFQRDYTVQGQTVHTDAINVFSWYEGADWSITTVDDEDVPEWLTIETEDVYETDEEGEEEFTGQVLVSAVAEPLPEGVKGRECTVKFFVTGAELTYHFIQGDVSGDTPLRGDVNGDGKVNVTDVTTLINMILEVINKDFERGDINGDGKINVTDVTTLVNIILGVIS